MLLAERPSNRSPLVLSWYFSFPALVFLSSQFEGFLFFAVRRLRNAAQRVGCGTVSVSRFPMRSPSIRPSRSGRLVRFQLPKTHTISRLSLPTGAPVSLIRKRVSSILMGNLEPRGLFTHARVVRMRQSTRRNGCIPSSWLLATLLLTQVISDYACNSSNS